MHIIKKKWRKFSSGSVCVWQVIILTFEKTRQLSNPAWNLASFDVLKLWRQVHVLWFSCLELHHVWIPISVGTWYMYVTKSTILVPLEVPAELSYQSDGHRFEPRQVTFYMIIIIIMIMTIIIGGSMKQNWNQNIQITSSWIVDAINVVHNKWTIFTVFLHKQSRMQFVTWMHMQMNVFLFCIFFTASKLHGL